MTSKSKAKGNRYEKEIRDFFMEKGFDAKRAWGSNGQSLGMGAGVDVSVSCNDWDTPLRIQCKVRKKLASYLAIEDGVDCVIFKEDRGKSYIMLELNKFVEDYL